MIHDYKSLTINQTIGKMVWWPFPPSTLQLAHGALSNFSSLAQRRTVFRDNDKMIPTFLPLSLSCSCWNGRPPFLLLSPSIHILFFSQQCPVSPSCTSSCLFSSCSHLFHSFSASSTPFTFSIPDVPQWTLTSLSLSLSCNNSLQNPHHPTSITLFLPTFTHCWHL